MKVAGPGLFQSNGTRSRPLEARNAGHNGTHFGNRSRTRRIQVTLFNFKGKLLTCFRVVIEALKPLDPQRQCHRLINGVLVERTVGQVLPALNVNYEKVSHL